MNLKYFRAGDVLAAFEMLEIADTLFTELPNEDPEEEGPGGKMIHKLILMFPPGPRVRFFSFTRPKKYLDISFFYSFPLTPECDPYKSLIHYTWSSLLLIFRQEGLSVFSREDFSLLVIKNHNHIYMFVQSFHMNIEWKKWKCARPDEFFFLAET